MRILRITVENLASLNGRHTVDFTAEPLRSAGLFAIIGPTGSGKSTLLDAMCLALYDRTPRLKQAPAGGEQVDGVSQQDSRSLLRRGAVEGSAEVAFISTDGQTLTARWSVRRARKKVTGQLQPVDMVLFKGDVREGEEAEQVCGGKKTAVLEAIEERIGLRFEQFTRAVLLAQNEFSTFLRSKDEERMEILEALTGTHQFRAISQEVFRRAAKENAAVLELETQRKGQVPLSELARQEAEQRKQQAEEDYNSANQELTRLQTVQRWHEDYRGRQASLTTAQTQHAEAITANTAAEPRRSQLARIERAQREAGTLYRELLSRQNDRQESDNQASAAANGQRAAASALDALRIAETDAEQAWTEHLNSQKIAQEQLDSARSIQLLSLPAEHAVNNASAHRTAAGSRHAEHERRLTELNTTADKLSQRRDNIEEQLQKLTDLSPFAGEASLCISHLKALDTAIRQQKLARSERDRREKAAAAATKELEEFLAQNAELQASLEPKRQELQTVQQDRRELDGDQLRQRENQLQANQLRLSRLQSQLENRRGIESSLRQHQESLDTEQTTQKTNQQEIETLQLQESAADIKRRASELAVTQLGNAFDDHAKRLRTTLQTGQKCPVCGATEHPFTNDPSDLETHVLQAAKQKCEEDHTAHRKLKDQLDHLRIAVELRETQLSELRQRVSEKEAELERFQFDNNDHTTVAEILALPMETRIEKTSELLRQISEELQQLTERITTMNNLDQQIRTLQDQCGELQEKLQARSQEQLKLSNAASAATQHTENQNAVLQDLNQRREEMEQLLAAFWQALPMARPEFEVDPEVFCRQLNEKFASFRDLQNQLAEARQELSNLESRKPQVSKDLQLAADELKQRTDDFNKAQKKLDDLRRQLHELLGERTVEEFEQEIKDREKSAREKLDNAKNERIKAEKQLTAATTHNNAMQKQLITAGQNEDAARSTLNRWLAEFSPQRGSDEALSELQQLLNHDGSWIQSERDALGLLAGNVSTAKGHADSCQQRLDELMRQRTDDREEAAVCLAIESQQEIVSTAEDEKQEAARVLTNDNETIGKNAELERRIGAASEQAEPWRKLSDLIGSADGKKFTLMAQRYTLDLLLQHANVQLRELARRYRLERLGDSLNLGVIDQDLGDELRSVHSLSGGETFLVSLALALGLASLTSSRLRIESLFIDEGFGSLDEDTLETAMNALNHLQSQGRKVGIITHVERMQDAITTQIHVRRGPGGSSRIVLPRAVE